ncbi:MAG: Hydroxyacylglutathione hydrolase [Chloroflexota bacterium]|nr:Hydroxyacylglutathione hydrolase [Chloroflexota bacterium]
MPLKRDRISEGIYVFTSGAYAEVTATVIFTAEGAIVVDTLPFPQETRHIREFLNQRRIKALYVVNTHSHADHIYGTYLFPEAAVIAHYQCRRLMERHAEEALAAAKQQTPQLADVKIRYPELLFNDAMTLRVGGKTIELNYSPGHSRDVITVHAVEDRLMVASDTVMPVPYVVGGDLDDMIGSITAIKEKSLENLVQGHGEVLLRGEIEETLEANIVYLKTVDRLVRERIARGVPRTGILDITIEECGLSRIALGGLVQKLHQANLLTLYDAYRSEMKARRAT